jgi:hypothetical protein
MFAQTRPSVSEVVEPSHKRRIVVRTQVVEILGNENPIECAANLRQ